MCMCKKQNPEDMLQHRDPGMGGRSPSLGTGEVGRLGQLLPLYPPSPDTGRRKRKCVNNGVIHFPLILNPSHPDQEKKNDVCSMYLHLSFQLCLYVLVLVLGLISNPL